MEGPDRLPPPSPAQWPASSQDKGRPEIGRPLSESLLKA